MSYTTIVDEDARARYFENRLNEIIRHCKIGKVTRKGSPSPFALTPKPVRRVPDSFELLKLMSPGRPVPALNSQRRLLAE